MIEQKEDLLHSAWSPNLCSAKVDFFYFLVQVLLTFKNFESVPKIIFTQKIFLIICVLLKTHWTPFISFQRNKIVILIIDEITFLEKIPLKGLYHGSGFCSLHLPRSL